MGFELRGSHRSILMTNSLNEDDLLMWPLVFALLYSTFIIEKEYRWQSESLLTSFLHSLTIGRCNIYLLLTSFSPQVLSYDSLNFNLSSPSVSQNVMEVGNQILNHRSGSQLLLTLHFPSYPMCYLTEVFSLFAVSGVGRWGSKMPILWRPRVQYLWRLWRERCCCDLAETCA